MPDNKTFSKWLIIFLIVFACIAFGITSALIMLKKNNYSEPNTTKMVKIDDSLGLNDLTQKYWVNNLETTEVTYNEGGRVWLSNYNNPYKLSVSYYTIDGLKDENIQNKINEKIKSKAFEQIPTEDAEAKSVYCYVAGNFSNILSLNFSSSYYIKKGQNDYEYFSGKSAGVTFDLTTGNEIELKDCFVDNANINVIISNSAYNSSAWDEKYMWGEWDEETEQYIEYDRRDLDEVALKTVLDIKKGNYSFTVNDYSINIIVPDNWVTINYEKYHDSIAIFNRFVTKESIFTNKYENGYEAYFGIPYMSKNINEPLDNLITVSDVYTDGYGEDGQEIEDLIAIRFELDEKLAKSNPDTVIIEVVGQQDYGWDLYDKVYDELIPPMKYNLECRGIHVLRAEIPKKFYIDNKIRDEIFNILRNGYNSERGEISYLFEDYFNSLKEKNSDITITSDAHGKIYSYDSDYDNWEQRKLNLLAQDFDKFKISSKLLTENDIEDLNADELNKLYNEIFARHGHDFKTKDLKEYFYGFLWYRPEANKIVSVDELNSVEQKNMQIIKNRIDVLKNGSVAKNAIVPIKDALIEAQLEGKTLDESVTSGLYHESFVIYNRPLKEATVEVRDKYGNLVDIVDGRVGTEYQDDALNNDISSVRIRMNYESSNEYTITVKNVVDKQGNKIEDYSFKVKTISK